MSGMTPGWRSRRWRADGGVAVAPALPPGARVRPQSAPVPAIQPPVADTPADWRVWKGVQFDLGFLGFCLYAITIITYIAPIGDVAMATALVGTLMAGRYRAPAPLLFYAAFMTWSLVGYYTSPFPDETWVQLNKDFKLLLIVAVAMNVLTTAARVRFFTVLMLAAFGLFPVRGAILNYFLYNGAVGDRVAWNHAFSNPNDLASYLLLPLSIAAAALHTERHRVLRLGALAGCLLIPLVVFLTGSRGAMLGLLCFVAVAVLTNKHRGRLLAAGAVGLALVIAFAPKSSWDRLFSVATADAQNLNKLNDQGSARERYEIWRVARAIAEDHPIFGVGSGAYRHVHYRYVKFQVRNFGPFAGGERDPHSTYLNVAAETGVPGAVLFFGIFVSAILFARKVQKRLAPFDLARVAYLRFMLTGLAAFGVAGVFGTYTHISFGLLFAALLWCTAKVYDEGLRRATGAAR